jgi:hypothetical protein
MLDTTQATTATRHHDPHWDAGPAAANGHASGCSGVASVEQLAVAL